MAHDGFNDQNRGFNENRCEQDLESINQEYRSFASLVGKYQTSGINVLCDNWISQKGVTNITKLVDNLNKFLDAFDSKLASIFDVTNNGASIISMDSDGISYSPVSFNSSDERFQNNSRAEDSGSVQWNEDNTHRGIIAIENFTHDAVRAIRGIAGNVNSIKSNFGSYSEYAAAINKTFESLETTADNISKSASKFMSGMDDAYVAEAKTHHQNMEQLQANKAVDDGEVEFNFE